MSKLATGFHILRDDGPGELTRKAWRTLSRVAGAWTDKAVRYRYTAREKPLLTMETPRGSIMFEVNPDWGRLPEIARGVVYEPALLHELDRVLRPNGTFYNIGARWGILSLFAGECGVRSKNIHNFEADAHACEILRRNCGNQRCIQESVGTGEGDTMSIDDYSSRHEAPPTTIKIDVEGHEYHVISGATKTIGLFSPDLYVELHPTHMQPFEDGMEATIQLLRQLGYQIEVADHRDGNAVWEPADDVELDRTTDHMLRCTRDR